MSQVSPWSIPRAKFWNEQSRREAIAMSDQHTTPTTFDLFILALSAFSLINIIWVIILPDDHQRNVVLIVDSICSVAFLADFFLRLHRAPVKAAYFLRQGGWLDLIGSFPFPLFRLARIFRVLRIYGPIRRSGGKGVLRQAQSDRAGSTLLVAIFLTIIVIQYASMAILWAEGHNADANIHTASDAIWWSYVTITTVGYGDRFPVTNLGRLVGFALLSTGVGLFAVITGFLANSFVARRRPPETPSVPPDIDERLRRLEALGDSLRTLSTEGTSVAMAETEAPGQPAGE